MNARWGAPAGLHTASARLPVEGELPSFGGATGWLNSPPLTPAGLRGKVVLAASGPTPASTGYASFPTFAPGPGNTSATDWWSSAFTRPSSRSSTTWITSTAP